MENSETNEDFTICVVIPAYNIADYIARAIDSVLAQTHKPDQIIVVDDGSTDNTAQIIKGYGDKVTYIHQENAGPAASRNTGIKNTDCDWVAFLDGDDKWLKDNLKLHVELLKRCPDLAWSSGNYQEHLYSEHRHSAHIHPQTLTKLMHCKDYFDNYFEAFRLGAGGHTNTMFMKRSAIEQVGPFQHGLTYSEDIDMWMRMAMTFPKIGFVKEPIAVYYLDRPGSLMHDTPKQEQIDTNLKLIDDLLKLAQNAGSLELFKPCATFMLKRWIRGMLFYNSGNNIRNILEKYSDLLSVGYISLMKLLTISPATTACCCHLISKALRMFNLRRRVVTLPPKFKAK